MSSISLGRRRVSHWHLGVMALIGVVAVAIIGWSTRPASAPASGCTGSDTRAAICALLADDVPKKLPLSYDGVADLQRFYTDRADQPAWSGTALARAQAAEALAVLAGAADDGLNASDYHEEELWGAARAPQDSATFDILLTDAVLRYAHDIRLGRVLADERDRDVSLPAQSVDLVADLAVALHAGHVGQFMRDQAPQHAEYQRLKTALARYRALASAGGWQPLPAAAKHWQSQPLYEQELVDRLSVEDTAFAAEAAAMDDAAIAAAIGRFQLRNGLHADGALGQDTLAALNIQPDARADQIAANMERWRWMPRTLESRYIMVNVPGTELRVVRDGVTVLTSRVIAGRPADPTPIIRAEARGIVVNPPWNVPAKIATREILPKLRRDSHYLEKEGMVLKNGPADDPYGLSIDWKHVSRLPYAVEQLPGPKAALGAVKIDMPNPFSVYLHDTPGKAAFALDRRNLSHGCVRVQQIVPLASFVLTGDADTAQESVQSALADGATKQIPAPMTTAVYFAYWTAFVDEDGTVEFRPDIYGRDRRLLAVLKGTQATRVTFAYGGCRAA